jgi:hypothetical protein
VSTQARVSRLRLLWWLLAAADVLHAGSPAVAATAPPGAAGPSAALADTQSAPKGPGSVSGVWLITNYKGSGGRGGARPRVPVTVDGKPAPLLPQAAALLDERIADADRGYPFANTLTSCLPGGMPLMIIDGAPYPIQILETAGQVTMLFEEQNHFRIIRMNAKHAEDPDPSYMGDSIGHWEGDTLVVDTVALTDRTTIDQVGMPHSEELHLLERYRRLDRDTLEVLVTLMDPRTFSGPWQTRALYKLTPAGTGVSEYICENNRNTPDAQGHMGFRVKTGGE